MLTERPKTQVQTVYVTFKEKGGPSKTVTVYQTTVEEAIAHFIRPQLKPESKRASQPAA